MIRRRKSIRSKSPGDADGTLVAGGLVTYKLG
jgi:hypothetical protein